jgi:hypothetical protein
MMGSTWKAQKNEERIKLTPGESCLILDPSLLYYHNACLVKACLRRNYPVIIFPPEDGHSLVPQHQVEAHVICQYFQETHANTHTQTHSCYFTYLHQRKLGSTATIPTFSFVLSFWEALLDEKSPTAAARDAEKSEPAEKERDAEKPEGLSNKGKEQHFTPREDSKEIPDSNSKSSDAHEKTENAEPSKAKEKPDAVATEKCLSPGEQETLITGKPPKKPGRPKGTGSAKAKAKASAKSKTTPKPKASAKAKAKASSAAAKAKAKAKSQARKAKAAKSMPEPTEAEAMEAPNTDDTLDYGEHIPKRTRKSRKPRKTGNKAEPETEPTLPSPEEESEAKKTEDKPEKPKRRQTRAASKTNGKEDGEATNSKGRTSKEKLDKKPKTESKKKKEKTPEQKAKHSRKSMAYVQAKKRALEQGCDEAQAKAAASKVICMH